MSAAKSRREIGARLGVGAAAFVASIVAPMPAQAQSCGTFFEPCSGGPGTGTCCAGLPTPRRQRVIWLDRTVVDLLGALRRAGESYSDVIMRLAAAA